MSYLDIEAISVGFIIAFLSSLIIVSTKKHHSSLTSDSFEGVQKFHSVPTPRIGGLPLFFGFVAACSMLEGEAYRILAWAGIASLPAFVLGLVEDIRKKGGVRLRLIATLISGVIFFFATGYAVETVQVWWLDFFLKNPIISVAFTAFAIGAATNAVNIIDGFHGLASGTILIMLASIGIVSWQIGDTVLLQIVLVIFAITLGFFLMNFPFGKIFLGDGGAYLLGFLISVLSVMLSARNPTVSPWICPLILSYPLTELVVSISRKIRREGHHPATPDELHLHMLVHGVIAKSKLIGGKSEFVQHAATSLTLWSFPLLSLLLVTNSGLTGFFAIRSTVIIFSAYLVLYSLIHILRARIAKSPVKSSSL